jgi:Tfp pilus assembly protein PilO
MMSKREKTIAWVAGLAIGAFALDSIVVSPLLARQESAQLRVADATAQLTKADQLDLNRRRAERVWGEMGGNTLKLDQPQAETQLLNHARDWAQRSGLELTSLKPERTELEQGFGKITVRASATGGMQSLARFMYEVQNAQIPVRIVDVTVNSRQEGTDELVMQVGLATIYQPPEDPDPRRGARREPRS